MLESEEVAAAVPDSDKTLKIEAFISCLQIDFTYFEKPYYLAPNKMDTAGGGRFSRKSPHPLP
ncbi:DNA end-binding protein Ku (plasmid) [Rhizobium favelukesii]|uniref:DNA end-binding protein Ku n=1 Tax=Rhizobium favelukesii TaxID=348824 RepID=W6RHL2_9HYPH|nr:DNA end-binding protein Ku [Rhizobium favelukesii]